MGSISEKELVEQGALPPDDFHNFIERIREISEYDIEVPANLEQRLYQEAQDLLISEETLYASAAALIVGNLVLQGPPGTGKSSLARALCRAFNCSIIPVTAHEDWTTYEVIGRQDLRINTNGQEEIIPQNGFFTESVIRCAGSIVQHFDEPTEPQATWLLIDELNRANLDKAFGELFTVLGTDDPVSIILPHQKEGNRELITPRRFRVIATLNSIDKQFVNSLSQGMKRRFTFVTVDIPPAKLDTEKWGEPNPKASLGSKEFLVVIDRATIRVSKWLALRNNIDIATQLQTLKEFMNDEIKDILKELFSFIEKVRYAIKDSGIPHIPIGTAQLIDTTELFLTRIFTEEKAKRNLSATLDWAASVKLAPLFDSDAIEPSELEMFAQQLNPPFNNALRRELLQIVAAGQYYIK